MSEENPSIKELCTVVEHCCDVLRVLRRDDPDHFFGQPEERMYESFESALNSFYRAKAHEK